MFKHIMRIVIAILLLYIAYTNYNYVKVGWCESEIQILRDQVSHLYFLSNK